MLTGQQTIAALGWGMIISLCGAFAWSYWPTVMSLWQIWSRDGDHSGGKVVAPIVAYLVWSDRKTLRTLQVRTCWWGLIVLVLAQAVRLGGILLSYGSIEAYSLVLTVVGVVLLVFGSQIAWRMKWVLLLLMLMVPLPRTIHSAIALPMQTWATASAVFGLELLGVLVARDGNVLRLGEGTTIAVAEACSGLRMLNAFIVVAAVMAFVVRRPRWQKAVLVLSSIPVAILANTTRLVATVLLFQVASSELAEKFFHDFAGLTMMPLAVLASVGLLALMKWLTAPLQMDDRSDQPVGHGKVAVSSSTP